MGKLNLFFRPKPSWSIKGFTLIELLVVITMVGVMTSFLFLFINPFKQLEKARDAQRVQNLKQVNSALDTFYNDNNSYPSSFSFEGAWQAGNTVYMKQVPQDPSCTTGGSCYTYVTDPSNPQWNVLFTKIYQTSVNSSTCALGPNCLPSNYTQSEYNYCVLSGEVDCAFISSITLPANAGAGTGGNGSGGGSTTTPTPTPTPSCLCANTDRHIAIQGQVCQGGGYSRLGIDFGPPVLAYFCPNVTNNCFDLSQAATDCP